MKDLYLKRTNKPTEQRAYRMLLLDGSTELITWRGKMQKDMTEKIDQLGSQEAALKKFEQLEREKRREGYVTATAEEILPPNYHFYKGRVSKPLPVKKQKPPPEQLPLFDGD